VRSALHDLTGSILPGLDVLPICLANALNTRHHWAPSFHFARHLVDQLWVMKRSRHKTSTVWLGDEAIGEGLMTRFGGCGSACGCAAFGAVQMYRSAGPADACRFTGTISNFRPPANQYAAYCAHWKCKHPRRKNSLAMHRN
jgi:hypothetical protein